MAITRRQFVTRLGALAAAAGFSQVEASKIMEAVAYNPASGPGLSYQGKYGKPRVVWLHGAECTGCSTSLLGIFENIGGTAIEGLPYSTADALGLSKALPVTNGLANTTSHFTLASKGLSPDPAGSFDFADLVIDVIDLLYHETIQGSGGDLAYQWLHDFKLTNNKPFVLVVEGAMQKTTSSGAWGDSSAVPWCSVAKDDAGTDDIVPADYVQALGQQVYCVAIVAIGQCAAFGGYPGCHPPISKGVAGFDSNKSQTDAQGVHDFLVAQGSDAAAKVINVPGCPTNPWWFVLSVVAFTVDFPTVFAPTAPGPGAGILPNTVAGGTLGPLKVLKTLNTGDRTGSLAAGVSINPDAVDGTRRLRAVYPRTVHGAWCSKFRYYASGVFAAHPGDTGCLQKLGCKGPSSHSLCTTHGWNNQQPENITVGDTLGAVTKANPGPLDGDDYEGGNCTRAGHPCMACTESGYPDAFVPFVGL